MPTTVRSKTAEVLKKSPTESNSESENKKLRPTPIKESESVVPRKTTEGETVQAKPEIRRKVAKKSSIARPKVLKTVESAKKEIKDETKEEAPKEPKPKKCTELVKGKKSSSVVIDKVPKKSAQRTKASISIRKSTEKAEVETAVQKEDPSSLPAQVPVEVPSVPKLQKENSDLTPRKVIIKQKTTKPIRVRSKITSGSKEEEEKDNKADVDSKVRKPWVSILEPESEGLPVEESKSRKNFVGAEHPTIPTCSFFEKIQQGVRAYFSPRTSVKPEPSSNYKSKKDIKEEGNQTKVGVENAVKEDRKRGKPKALKYFSHYGLKFKNKNNYSESALFRHPRLILKISKSGGKPSNFFETKNKIKRHFQMQKRKKLYHPKKHYVKIQIPRKGYFYRSTVLFKANEPSSHSLLRMEPVPHSKTKPQIQISGLAPTSPKVSDIRQKRVKLKKLNFSPSTITVVSKTKNNIVRKRSFAKQNNLSIGGVSNSLPLIELSNSSNDNIDANKLEPSLEYLRDNVGFIKENNISFEEFEKKVDDTFLSNYPLKYASLLSGKEESLLSNEKDFSQHLNENTADNFLHLLITNEGSQQEQEQFSESPVNPKALTAKIVEDGELLSQNSIESELSLSNNSNEITSEKTSGIDFDAIGGDENNVGDLTVACVDNTEEPPAMADFGLLLRTLNSFPIEESFISNLTFSSFKNFREEFYDGYKFFQMGDFVVRLNGTVKDKTSQLVAQKNSENMAHHITDFMNARNQTYFSTLEESHLCNIGSNFLNKRNSTSNLGDNLETNMRALLMGEIDLQSELENYIKKADSLNSISLCKFEALKQSGIKYSLNQKICGVPNTKLYKTEVKDPIQNLPLPTVNVNNLLVENNLTPPKDYLKLKNSEEFFDAVELKPNHSFGSETSLTDNYYDMFYTDEKNEWNLFGNSLAKENVRSSENQEEDLETPALKIEFDGNVSELLEETDNEDDDNKRALEEILLKKLDDEKKSDSSTGSKPISLKSETYEKILPLKPRFNRKKFRGSCEDEDFLCSKEPFVFNTFSNSFPQLINTSRNKNTRVIKNKTGKKQKKESEKKWTPNLQELTDIYASILKQNHKLQMSGRKSLQCVYKNLLSFADNKVKEKKMRSDLIKEISGHTLFKIKNSLNISLQECRAIEKKANARKIEEYVRIVQRILLSSLSISQIIQLNNIIAGIEDFPQETSSTSKINTKKTKNVENHKRYKIIEKDTEECLNDRKDEYFELETSTQNLDEHLGVDSSTYDDFDNYDSFGNDTTNLEDIVPDYLRPIHIFDEIIPEQELEKSTLSSLTDINETLNNSQINKLLNLPVNSSTAIPKEKVTENNIKGVNNGDKLLLNSKIRDGKILPRNPAHFKNVKNTNNNYYSNRQTPDLHNTQKLSKKTQKNVIKKAKNYGSHSQNKTTNAYPKQNVGKLKNNLIYAQNNKNTKTYSAEPYNKDGDTKSFAKKLINNNKKINNTYSDFTSIQKQLKTLHPLDTIVEEFEKSAEERELEEDAERTTKRSHNLYDEFTENTNSSILDNIDTVVKDHKDTLSFPTELFSELNQLIWSNREPNTKLIPEKSNIMPNFNSFDLSQNCENGENVAGESFFVYNVRRKNQQVNNRKNLRPRKPTGKNIRPKEPQHRGNFPRPSIADRTIFNISKDEKSGTSGIKATTSTASSTGMAESKLTSSSKGYLLPKKSRNSIMLDNTNITNDILWEKSDDENYRNYDVTREKYLYKNGKDSESMHTVSGLKFTTTETEVDKLKSDNSQLTLKKSTDTIIIRNSDSRTDVLSGDLATDDTNDHPTTPKKQCVVNIPVWDAQEDDVLNTDSDAPQVTDNELEVQPTTSTEAAETAVDSLNYDSDNQINTKKSTNTIIFENTRSTIDYLSEELSLDDSNNFLSSSLWDKRLQLDNARTENDSALQKQKQNLEGEQGSETIGLPNSSSGNHSSTITVENCRRQSSVLTHFCDGMIDDASFPPFIIQSESFLKGYPGTVAPKAQIKSFLKLNSDMKFHPGRVRDQQSKSEDIPLVTFVLTPKQNEEANLPANQVKVVDKAQNSQKSEQPEEKKENKEEDKEGIDGQLTLDSIEEFIKKWSKTSIMRKRSLANQNKKNSNGKINPHSSKKIFCAIPNTSRGKPFYECQKRQLTKQTVKRNPSISKDNIKKVQKRLADKYANLYKISPNLKRKANENSEKNFKHKKHLEKPISSGKLKSQLVGVSKGSKQIIEAKSFKEKLSMMENKKKNNFRKIVNLKESHLKELNLSSNMIDIILSVIAKAKKLQESEAFAASKIRSMLDSSEQKENGPQNTENQVAPKNNNKSPEGVQSPSDSSKKIKINDEEPKPAKTEEDHENPDESSKKLGGVINDNYCIIKDLKKSEEILASVSRPFSVEKTNILDSLISVKNSEECCLEQKSSIYFDAIDYLEAEGTFSEITINSNKKDLTLSITGSKTTKSSKDSTSIYTQATEGDIEILPEIESTNDTKPKDPCVYICYKQQEFSSDSSLKENPDQLIEDMMDNSKISNAHSLELLEDILRAEENFTINDIRDAKIQNVLRTIKKKSQNLLITMEKKAWFKIISLINEILEVLSSTINDKSYAKIKSQNVDPYRIREKKLVSRFFESFAFIKNNLDLIETVLNNLQTISNDSLFPKILKEDNLSKENLFFQSFKEKDKVTVKNISPKPSYFYKISECFNFVLNKLNWSKDDLRRSIESFESCDKEDSIGLINSGSNFSGILLERKKSLPNLVNLQEQIVKEFNVIQCIELQIIKQRILVEKIIGKNSDTVPPEIQEIRNKVIENIKLLQEIVSLINNHDN